MTTSPTNFGHRTLDRNGELLRLSIVKLEIWIIIRAFWRLLSALGFTDGVKGFPSGGRLGWNVPMEEPMPNEVIRLTATEAVAGGVALRAVPRADLHDEIARFITKLLPTSRTAIAATKLALIQAEPTRPGCAAELALFADFVTHDPLASEGYRSWVEKRKPSWP